MKICQCGGNVQCQVNVSVESGFIHHCQSLVDTQMNLKKIEFLSCQLDFPVLEVGW